VPELSMNYSDYFNIVLRMLSNGAEPYEIFDELSKFGSEMVMISREGFS